MKLYPDDLRKECPLYAGVMDNINELYTAHGTPEMLTVFSKTTTTGDYLDPYWSADTLGDWDGDEADIASRANLELGHVLTELGLMGNGGISYCYTTPAWEEFVAQANQVVEAFHAHNAFEKLHELYV